nr:hypothetical protein GCM10020185_39600 [Pseudomonas brassicacearum subsp. brassicacearum]
MLTQVQQGMGLEPASMFLGAFQCRLQAGLGQVVGSGIRLDPVDPHGEHRPFITAQTGRFGDILAHRQVLAGLAHVTQGKEFSARAQGSKTLLELGVEVEHGTSLSGVAVQRGAAR